jgi:2-oxoglutarate ferredoxin oxidoreductase subunit alpha
LEATRQGPATGLPTWTSQGDLNFVWGAGHGDFLRVILTPSSVEEHYLLTQKAFYLAEKYQLPVFILSDKQMLESQQTMPIPAESVKNQRYSMVAEGKLGEVGLSSETYRRYADNPTGISVRSIPGQDQGWQLTNSYDHDLYGFASEEEEVIKAAVEKRARKLPALLQEIPEPRYFGPENPEKILLAFGSTAGVIRDYLAEATDSKVALIEFPALFPFPQQAFEKLLEGKNAELWTVEGNATGQLAGLVHRETDHKNIQSFLRYDGRPFYVVDLKSWLETGKVATQYATIEAKVKQK